LSTASSPPVPARAYVLRVLDVAGSLDLDRAERDLGPARTSRGPLQLRGPMGQGAGGILLARRPLDVSLGPRKIAGFDAEVRVRLFDFGVAVVRFEIALPSVGGDALVSFAGTVEDDAGFDAEARAVYASLRPSIAHAISGGSSLDFVEDYTVLVLPEPPDDETIARVLLGETSSRPLAAERVEEVKRNKIRYFADDLVVIDYDAAIVVDPQGSAELVDIFELATAHLLELRYYDQLLSQASASMTANALQRKVRLSFFRSPFATAAERAVLLVLELTELADSFERSIVLLGDAYSVEVYRMAAERFRIQEASHAVHAKLSSLARSAEVLSDHVHARRSLLLEVMVIVLIAFEIVMALVARH
jgi:hypothetical protein